MPHYLLLMRHAKHEADPNDAQQRQLSVEGGRETKEVGERLIQVIQEFNGDDDLRLNVTEIWHAGTSEIVATLNKLNEILGEGVTATVVPQLNPEVFNPYKNTKTHAATRNCFEEWTKRHEQTEAVLLIGHQPFLCWLGYHLSGQMTPLVHSELACVAFTPNWRGKLKGKLRWILTPSNAAAAEDLKDLKEKIKSKMEIAKLLGAAITGVLAFLLGYLVDGEKLAQLQYFPSARIALLASTITFLVSIALYFATMYAYDRLLMPTRFWGETQPPGNPSKRPGWLVWRPPSSNLWVLYQNMMRVWRYLFNGATYAVIIGMLLLTYAVFHPTEVWTISLFVGGSVVGALLFWWAYRHLGPRLGAED